LKKRTKKLLRCLRVAEPGKVKAIVV